MASWRAMLNATFDDIDIVKYIHVIPGIDLSTVESDEISSCDLILKIKSDSIEKQNVSVRTAIIDIDIVEVPSLVFSGFHPDVCYITQNGKMVKNAFSKDWNSRILFWGFQNGLKVNDALQLFNTEVFEALGYFNAAGISKDQLRKNFASCNLDFEDWMQKIQREGNFMLGPNHPKLSAFSALADQMGAKIGRSPKIPWSLIGTYALDPLASSFVWPIHLPIADYLGIENSDRVRSGESYVNFEEFAANCFEYWSNIEIDDNKVLVGGSNYHKSILEKYVA